MDSLLIKQLIVSFIAGGITITFLTFLAEHVNERISGIVLAFPSTAVLGYFFLGWAVTPQEVAKIVPSTLIPLGITAFYPVFYVYVAMWLSATRSPKGFQVLLTAFLGFIFWLIFSIPAAIFQVKSYYLGTWVYLIMIIAAHLLLRKHRGSKRQNPSYTTSQKIGRALFVGLIISIIVLMGKLFNPFWGGMFAMAPAAFSSSLMVLHWQYHPSELFSFVRKIAIGTLSIYAYSLAVACFFPWVGIIAGTLIALFISLITAMLLSRLHLVKQLIYPHQNK